MQNQNSEDGKDSVGRFTDNCLVKSEGKSSSSESYKKRTTVFISRDKFLDIVCDALAEYKYVGPNQRKDLILACR